MESQILKSALLFWVFHLILPSAYAKEIALTFDDAPSASTPYFETHKRTEELIRKLDLLKIPSVLIFANPCKREDISSVLEQLKQYRDRGHVIGNHTCTHPRLDEVGFTQFANDAERADQILRPLFSRQKFFRFPYLNEGSDARIRDQMREWLKSNQYRNGMVSADNEDPIFSYKLNQAKKLGKKINYEKVKRIFLRHILSSLACSDELAREIIGYSPKHVLLLHEIDATVMFLDALVNELRKEGWTVISATDAYEDKLYFQTPQNIHAGNGIISQLAYEKMGKRTICYDFEAVKAELNEALGL